jgi:pyruvate formate lyase activating enzyme
MKREAMYYRVVRDKSLACELCPRYCVLEDGEQGLCRSRKNIEGKLYATNYALATGLSLDRIEKKPLYHYYPGSRILSLGPNSCNLQCSFCQNYRISQLRAATQEISLDFLQEVLAEHSPGALQVAFTYTEPITWYEYILDFALAYPEVRIVLISNGYINAQPLAELLPYVSAMNIDLKAMNESFYASQSGGHLEPVLQNIRACVDAGVHLELTFLLIPGLNDAEEELFAMRDFIYELNPELPLHVSAYHPDYQMIAPATRTEDIARAIDIFKKSLVNVYGGNLPVTDYMDTTCPGCGKKLIARSHGMVKSFLMAGGTCPQCGAKVFGEYE